MSYSSSMDCDWIKKPVLEAGILPFRDFMNLALYDPTHGYYEQKTAQIGKTGDFYTSVSAGPLFGRLLAFQFGLWQKQYSWPKLQVVEAGAHDGCLASDFLEAWNELWPQGQNLQYIIMEPSPRRRSIQEEKLTTHSAVTTWVSDWNDIPPQSLCGVIFSNELLDAFPVHRLGWNTILQQWFEWGVVWEEDHFEWKKLSSKQMDPQSTFRSQILDRLNAMIPTDVLKVLPADFTLEFCPAAADWWHQAAGRLNKGFLCTLDYGLLIEEILSPVRQQGTLKAFHRHQQSKDILANPGQQDITASVNFSHLEQTGLKDGLTTESISTQEQFLTRILRDTMKFPAQFGEWTPDRIKQFKTLAHPSHLGQVFRVLLQSRH